VVQFIAARAAELSDYSQAQLAAELGTSADTVRRALEKAASSAAEQEA
jgi:DNA-directed RNA polymerase specialized sigma24 family protein